MKNTQEVIDLNYILNETECFIYNACEMKEFIKNINNATVNTPKELYNWAKKYFNKCHVMLIEEYTHTTSYYFARELKEQLTCRWDSGIVGIIAVAKKRFRNPEKTKHFMRYLVEKFNDEL